MTHGRGSPGFLIRGKSRFAGQPVVNRCWKVAAELTREIRQLEDRSGLSPKARMNQETTFRERATLFGDGRSVPDDDRHRGR